MKPTKAQVDAAKHEKQSAEDRLDTAQRAIYDANRDLASAKDAYDKASGLYNELLHYSEFPDFRGKCYRYNQGACIRIIGIKGKRCEAVFKTISIDPGHDFDKMYKSTVTIDELSVLKEIPAAEFEADARIILNKMAGACSVKL